MEGGNLLQNIAARRVTWYRRGRRIAVDVAKGLVFLHSRRIVHVSGQGSRGGPWPCAGVYLEGVRGW